METARNLSRRRETRTYSPEQRERRRALMRELRARRKLQPFCTALDLQMIFWEASFAPAQSVSLLRAT
jgi:hypothetical protein